ncbi:hypothetical protein Tco_1030546 [Tanacetum coccineum]|uniref:Uncharacterized protein n=1 Tax=Tanacetum coccineum TaxID=301880 RepID=A0ABQ5G711_9ASTR
MSQPANDEFSQHLSDDEASNHEDASDTGAAPKQQQQVYFNSGYSNSQTEYEVGKLAREYKGRDVISNSSWKI